jgi:hypothetical protein
VTRVRERTTPTERPLLVAEVNAKFADRGVTHGQCSGSPTAVISISRPDLTSTLAQNTSLEHSHKLIHYST